MREIMELGIAELGILITIVTFEIMLGFVSGFVPLLLYFYNLSNPTGKTLKNIALRMATIGLIPAAYDLLAETSMIYLFFFSLILSLFWSYFFSTRYFRHLFFIGLYYLTTFALHSIPTDGKYFIYYDALPNGEYLIFYDVLDFILLVPSFLLFSLFFYWLFGLLFFRKSYLNGYDGICLLWCVGLILINPINHPTLKLLIYDPLFSIFNLNIWLILIFFVPPFTIFSLIIFLRYGRYFFNLYRDKKFKDKLSRQ